MTADTAASVERAKKVARLNPTSDPCVAYDRAMVGLSLVLLVALAEGERTRTAGGERARTAEGERVQPAEVERARPVEDDVAQLAEGNVAEQASRVAVQRLEPTPTHDPADALPLRHIAPGIWSGPRLATPADARTLAAAGITTTLSVDAFPTRPDAEAAGLTRLHVPIGYDGPDAHQRHQLAAALRQWQATRREGGAGGGLYVHCHHGRHRGPAVAVLLARWNGATIDARSVLREAGTAPRYTGLWAAVHARRPSDAIVAEQPPVPSEATAAPLALAMAALEAAIEADDGVLIDEAVREIERATAPRTSEPPSQGAATAGATTGWDAAAWDETVSSLHATRQQPAPRTYSRANCLDCHTRTRDPAP